MEAIAKIFDGDNILLTEEKRIPLAHIRRASLSLEPYLVFPVWREVDRDTRKKIPLEIIYPHTAVNQVEKEKMAAPGERSTRIMHIVPLGSTEVIRKPDFKQPHTVKLTAYHSLTLELKNNTQIKMNFEGNCHYLEKDIEFLNSLGKKEVLREFFDRPALVANVLKKNQIEVYAK